MLKEISIAELQVDMYIHEIVPGDGLRLPKRKNGRVTDGRVIDKFIEIGVRTLIIDTDKGIDIQPAGMPKSTLPPSEPLPTGQAAIESALQFFAEETSEDYRALSFEWFTAKEIFTVSTAILAESFAGIHNGRPTDMSQFSRAAKAIAKSLKRNKDALIWFGKLRHLDNYKFEHAVNCAVLIGIVGLSLELGEADMEEAILGALLQNIGEAKLPENIVNHAGKLTEAEMRIVQGHVSLGEELLAFSPNVSLRVQNIVAQHHERADGSGYPRGLKKEEIDRFALLAAIVDSYDALSTKKSYREAIPPSQAMKIVLEDSKTLYDEVLVHQFIKCMGIYPTGALVKLSNDKLAIVMEQSQGNRLEPDVKVIYNLKTAGYLVPHLLRLSSDKVKEKIIGYEDPRKYAIDVTDFMPSDADFS